jgi:hypothetical protein
LFLFLIGLIGLDWFDWIDSILPITAMIFLPRNTIPFLTWSIINVSQIVCFNTGHAY